MRILHIVNDAQLGGAQTLLLRLARYRRPEDEVHLIVLRSSDVLSAEYEHAFRSVTYLELESLAGVPRAMRDIRRLSRNLSPDIVHSHLLQSDLLSLLAIPMNLRRISTVHTTGMSDSDPRLSRVVAQLVGRLSGRFDCIVTCSDRCHEFMKSYEYRPRRTESIANGVEMPATWSQSGQSGVVLSVARFHPMKGHDLLFEAFHDLAPAFPDLRLRCVGEGLSADNKELMQLLERSGCIPLLDAGRIELVGPSRNVRDELAGATVLVISSRYGEAAPMVGIESISSGRGVIGPDLGNIPSLVAGKDMLFTPGSAPSLSGALKWFLQLPLGERHRLEREGRAVAEQSFSIEACVEAYGRVYETV